MDLVLLRTSPTIRCPKPSTVTLTRRRKHRPLGAKVKSMGTTPDLAKIFESQCQRVLLLKLCKVPLYNVILLLVICYQYSRQVYRSRYDVRIMSA